MCWTSQLERGEAGAVTSGIRRRSSPRRLAASRLHKIPGQAHRRTPIVPRSDSPRMVVPRSGVSPEFVTRSGRSDWEAAHFPGSVSWRSPRRAVWPGGAGADDDDDAQRGPVRQRDGRNGRGARDPGRPVPGREYMWAARVRWMLRAFGFDDAVVLDGGWRAWTAQGRPVCTEPCAYAPAQFVAEPRPGLFVGVQDVLGAIEDPDTAIVSALGRRQHRGEINEYSQARAHSGSEERLSVGRPGQDDGPVPPARRTPPDVRSDPRRRACHHPLRRRHRSVEPGLRAAPARPPQRWPLTTGACSNGALTRRCRWRPESRSPGAPVSAASGCAEMDMGVDGGTATLVAPPVSWRTCPPRR